MLDVKKLLTKILTKTTVTPTSTYGTIANNCSFRIGNTVFLSFRFTASQAVSAYTSFIGGLPTIKATGSTQFSVWARLVSSSTVSGMIGLSAYGDTTTLSNWVSISKNQVVDIIGFYTAK